MTRRTSLRAAARENYVAMAKGQGANASNGDPPPSLSLPHKGGDENRSTETNLTTRVRELYEESAVPVREIAAVAGISVRGKVAASETDVPDERLVDFIVSWPGKWPKGAKGKGPGK